MVTLGREIGRPAQVRLGSVSGSALARSDETDAIRILTPTIVSGTAAEDHISYRLIVNYRCIDDSAMLSFG